MNLLRVDQTKCVKCGLCATACPRGLIQLQPEWPSLERSELCVACGHCVAVCPTEALDNLRAPLEMQSDLPEEPVLSEQVARLFLRSRRSIRNFRNDVIPREKLLQLMDIARFAPTGGNSQGLSYRVIEDRHILTAITAQTVEWMDAQAQKDVPAAKSFAQYVSVYRQTGQDVILRNAPHFILALADRSFARGRENSHFSLAYLELFAPSLGLGSCWAGLFEAAAFAGYKPLVDLLGIPAEKLLTGAVMVGIPAYRFKRMPERNPLNISFA